jgi:hypothetical protein
LLRGLRPSYHVIADFRKDNAKGLKQAGREFVHLCGELGLIGGTRFGIDGMLLNGWASGKSVKTKAELPVWNAGRIGRLRAGDRPLRGRADGRRRCRRGR